MLSPALPPPRAPPPHTFLHSPLTREQLLKGLEILGPQSHPLPFELPPSPPASRESSPAPGIKRRHEPDSEPQHHKKPRTSSSSSTSRPQLPSRPVPIPSSSRHEPSEDGEVKEEPSESRAFTPITFPANFPSYARVAAAHPTTSKDYKALHNPLDPNSPYAKHSLLMARLELVDSLLHFIYGLWGKENAVRMCYRASWRTVEEAISKTEAKWQAESRDDREKAFLGLIEQLNNEQLSLNAFGQHASPPVATPALPPSNRDQASFPPANVTHPVNAQYVWENKSQSGGLRAALDRIHTSQQTLSLPVLCKHFPRTFARVINTTLSPTDEHEPDFQDDECELYWPGQVITGDGLGWVCLMGMSMIRELGREYGYQGVDGVILRRPGDATLGHADPRFDPHTR
uniref:Aspartyl proteinase n=1 Tax=Ganoderma boninense TaxID=34458 RepID=A0A5K1JYE0_9APHY|nr:Aspartyl proteinase [Ganoderma boninense]